MSTLKRRMDSSVPTAADRARLKRRMNSPVSRSDSSSEPCKGCDCDLMATLPLCCVYAAPHWTLYTQAPRSVCDFPLLPLSRHSRLRGTDARSLRSDRAEHAFGRCVATFFELLSDVSCFLRKAFPRTHPAPAEGERAVIRARQLPIDRRQVNFLVSETVLRRNMAGGVANDPFTAYQEAAKVMSAKKGSSSRSASRDEVVITGSRRSTVVKLGPSPSLPEKRPKSGGDSLGTLRLRLWPERWAMNPGDSSFLEYELLESGDLSCIPEVVQRSGDYPGARKSHKDPEVIWEPGGRGGAQRFS
ncbi:hypothetical protein YC2023_098240 [Brassica napus]